MKNLEYLRSLIQSVEKPRGRESFRGSLIEITGPGKTSEVIRCLAENPKLRAAWIEESLTIYPPAFLQRNVSLERVLFIEAGREFYWAASQVLRSGLFEIVVLSFRTFLDERVMRRLQLETEKANAGFFLLPEAGGRVNPSASWTLAHRINMKDRKQEYPHNLNASWKETS